MTAPHAVLPSDEGRHAPDGESLWNESYYCDFVTNDGSLGGWLRLGLYPNREVAWWTAWIVRPATPGSPGSPGICSVDYRAPVPPGDTLVSESPVEGRSGGRIEIELRRELEEFRLAAHVPATAIDDPADVYTKGEHDAGPSVDLDLDLTWTTDGSPYHYELTTRYEIPCLVTGSVTIEGETFIVEGQGQRDHSWGVRDWWAFGWCWCSMRLDDGTRVHLADIRMPGMPVFFGYIQTPGEVNPVTALSVTEELGPHGFPDRRPHPDRGGGCARHRDRRDAGRLRPGAVARRRPGRGRYPADESLPACHGDLSHRRRPIWLRLDRMEPT